MTDRLAAAGAQRDPGDPGDPGATPPVLVLRALGLGDALTGVAALRGVRRAWPGRRVVLAGPAVVGAWLRDLGVVDDVVGVDGLDLGAVERLPWDGSGHVAVNLHGRGPQSHALLQATGPERLVAFAAPEAGHDGPPWRADEHEVERWCRLVSDAGGECSPEDLRLDRPDGVERGGEVVLHPGAASGSRRWPVERWCDLARHLVSDGHPVAVTGSAGEAELTSAVASAAAAVAPGAGVRDLAGALDLPDLARTVAGARLLVCGDTGVAHVATAFGTPSVVLFGPTPPTQWGPAVDREIHTVLWHGDPHDPGDPHADAVDPALAAITLAEVLTAAAPFLT